MPLPTDPEWQRDTHHPSTTALLSFLETDLDSGMRLACGIEYEPDPAARTRLLADFETVNLEVVRWIDRARQRNVPVPHLAGRIDQFRDALADARRKAAR